MSGDETSPAVASAAERFMLRHKEFVRVPDHEPLYYREGDWVWSTMAVVEIFDIPPAQTIQSLALAIIAAGGIEIFKYRQRVSFARLINVYLPPADFVEEPPENELVWRQWRTPQGWAHLELIDCSVATWEVLRVGHHERPAMKLHTGIPDKFVQPEEVTGESLLRFIGARCDHLAGKVRLVRNGQPGESLFAPFGGPAGAIKPLTDDELRRELAEVVADLEKYLPTLRRLAHNQ